MGIRAKYLREEYPDLTDEEVARAYALESGYHVVVMYEDQGGLAFKGLRYDQELDEVRSSPCTSNVRILYDDGQIENSEEASKKAAARAREAISGSEMSDEAYFEQVINNNPFLRKQIQLENETKRKKWWQFWK